MSVTDPPVVAVFGDSAPRPGEEAYETARAAGRRLAELGYAVANGGYRGTMEASARGAREAGGRTIGVLCSLWRSRPNAFLDRTVTVDNLYDRVGTLIEFGSAGYVVLPGGTGTLVEVAVAWELLCKDFLPPRPLVCVGAFWQPMIDAVCSARPSSRETIRCIAGPEELGEHFPLREGTE